jgi:hypothetical protein
MQMRMDRRGKHEVGIILLVTKMPQRERLALLVAASLRVL